MRTLSANCTGWHGVLGASTSHRAGSGPWAWRRCGCRPEAMSAVANCNCAAYGLVTHRAPGPAAPEWKAWLVCQPGAADSLVTQLVDDLLEDRHPDRQHCVGPVVGADRHPGKLASDLLDVLGVGETTPAIRQAFPAPEASTARFLAETPRFLHSSMSCRTICSSLGSASLTFSARIQTFGKLQHLLAFTGDGLSHPSTLAEHEDGQVTTVGVAGVKPCTWSWGPSQSSTS